MEQIRLDGLIAAPVVYVLLRRLECTVFRHASKEERELWNDDLYTGDAFVAYPEQDLSDNSFRYIHDFFKKYDIEKICEINPISGEGVYKFRNTKFEPSDGILFHSGERDFPSGFVHSVLTLEHVLDSRLWKVAARHPDTVKKAEAWDARLLKEYARRCVFPLSQWAMPLYIGNSPYGETELGAVKISNLDTWPEDNSAFFKIEQIEREYVTGLVTNGRGRIIGITSKAFEAARRRSKEVCKQLANRPYPRMARKNHEYLRYLRR